MAELSGLSVEVTAETASAVASLSRAEESIDDIGGEALQTAMAMRLLQSQTDKAGNQMLQLGAQAPVASLGMGTVSTSATTASASLLQFGVSTGIVLSVVSALILVLVALAAVLGTIAVAAAGVAAGFVAIGLPVLLNRFEDLRAIATDTFEKIRVLIEPLADRFFPLFADGLRAIPNVVDDIIKRVGGLDSFAQTLRSFGETAADALPSLIAGLIRIGEKALPALEELINFLVAEGPGAFRAIEDTFNELEPTLSKLIERGLEGLPDLLIIATRFTKVLLALSSALQPVSLRMAALVVDIGNFTIAVRKKLSGLGTAFRIFSQIVQGAFASVERIGRSVINFIIGGLNDVITAIQEGLKFIVQLINQANELPKVGGFLDEALQVDQIISKIDQVGQGSQTNINIGSIQANSRREGRDAARGAREEFGRRDNTLDSSRGV